MARSLLSPRLARRRYAAIRPFVRGEVLEIGCGTGRLIDEVGPAITRYVGLDLREELVQVGREGHPEAEFLVCDADWDALPDVEPFDVIVMTALLEHIENLGFLMRNIDGALRPDGRVVITTPSVIGNDFVLRATSRVNLTSKSAPVDHVAVFNRYRLENLAKRHGFHVARHRRFMAGLNQMFLLERQ